jgi:hypothetical protein
VTPLTIFTPAANTNGAIIWSAQLTDEPGAATQILETFIAKTSAPTTVGDGEIILQSQHAAMVSGGRCFAASLAQPQRIAAGKGLYFISSVASLAGAGLRSCRYTLL